MPLLALPDGGSLYYEMTGPGKPNLLFMHGWTGEGENWWTERRYFSDRYNVITVDFRGHGKSSKERGLSVQLFAQDIRCLLEKMQLTDVCAFGHSMGALVLMEYIQQYGTTHLHKIGFVDQSPKLLTDDGWPYGIYGDFTEQTNERFVAGLHHRFVSTMVSFDAHALRDDLTAWAKEYDGPFFFPDYIQPEVMIDIWDSIIHADYRQLLPKLDRPVWLAYGQHSQFYPRGIEHYMKQQIPQAEVVVFPSAKHSPLFEESAAFCAALDTFLKS